jgi:hypothetical protein
MMKFVRASLALGLLGCASLTLAAEISVESKDWQPASPYLSNLIQKYAQLPGDVDCKPLQRHPLDAGLDAVTTSSTCWGSATAPVWIVTSGPIPKVLFEAAGYVIRTSRSNAQHPTITIIGGNAGSDQEERWKFTAGKYTRMYFSVQSRAPN